MENRQTGLMRFAIKLSAVLGAVFLLFACQTVQMPDLSNIDLGLSKQDAVVTIKPDYKNVNIRPTPSTNQPPVGTLKGGDQVKMTAEHNDWFNIIYYDTTGTEQAGWVYKYLIVGYEKPFSESSSSKPRDVDKPAEAEPSTEDDNTTDDDISIL